MRHICKALWRDAQLANYFSAFWGVSGPQCLPYMLNASDDSEGELYKAEGQKRTLRGSRELVISLATNLLIEKLGVQNIRATVHELGADGMNVARGVEDKKAFQKGLNNTTTARGLAVLLQAIAEGKAVDAASSHEMVAIQQWQKFNEGIPAGLPKGTPVAHKTGGDHKNSSPCSDRVCEAAIHFGNSGARAGEEEIQRPVDGGR
jgi:hypothetical protein